MIRNTLYLSLASGIGKENGGSGSGLYIPPGVQDENHNQGAGACNIESSVGDIGWWGGITTIVDIYDDKKRNFGFKNIR